MGKLKLFVDDIRRAPDEWCLARTITEAIRILATNRVDEVSLDHDIAHLVNGLEASYSTCPENYSAVAWYIAAMCVDDRPKRIRIHSANPNGAKEMAAILIDAGIKCVEISMFGTRPEDGVEACTPEA
jgi:hypothetical protein